MVVDLKEEYKQKKYNECVLCQRYIKIEVLKYCENCKKVIQKNNKTQMGKLKGVCVYCGKEKTIYSVKKQVCSPCHKKYFWVRKKRICEGCKKNTYLHSKKLCKKCYDLKIPKSKKEEMNKKRNAKRFNLNIKYYKKLTKKCVLCGFNLFTHLHHIDFNKKNNSVNNLICLCPNHHALAHYKKYKKEIFKKLLKLKKSNCKGVKIG